MYNNNDNTSVISTMDASKLQAFLDLKELQSIKENVPLYSDMEVEALRDFYCDMLLYSIAESDSLQVDSFTLYLNYLSKIEIRPMN